MIKTITLEGPAKNALSETLMRDIIAQVKDADGAPLLITGSGDTFSAGLDLKALVELDQDGLKAYLDLLEEMVEAIFLYPGPTCALVNGHAIAGGAIITICCDLSVAAVGSRARVGLNETALGVGFPPKLFNMVHHCLVPRYREAIMLGGALFNVKQAAELGMLKHLDDDPAGWAQAELERLGGYPGGAYGITKKMLRAGVPDVSEAELANFIRDILPLWCSDALKARISAMLNRGRRGK